VGIVLHADMKAQPVEKEKPPLLARNSPVLMGSRIIKPGWSVIAVTSEVSARFYI